MHLLNHSDLSGFVEQLIREEYERRNGPLSLKDAPSKTPMPASQPVTYSRKAKSQKG